MPYDPEKGPNNQSRNPEIRPGQKTLKDDAATRQKLGGLAIKGPMNDKNKK